MGEREEEEEEEEFGKRIRKIANMEGKRKEGARLIDEAGFAQLIHVAFALCGARDRGRREKRRRREGEEKEKETRGGEERKWSSIIILILRLKIRKIQKRHAVGLGIREWDNDLG